MTKKRPVKSSAKGTDWARVDAFTDCDIERMAKADKENPASKTSDWADAVIGLPPLKAIN